jgi:hypothetical protein
MTRLHDGTHADCDEATEGAREVSECDLGVPPSPGPD